MGRSAKRFKRWEQEQLEKQDEAEKTATEEMETNDEEAINKEPDNVAEELERNCHLLEELVRYQQSRFSAGKTKWDAVEDKEVEIGKFLFFGILYNV